MKWFGRMSGRDESRPVLSRGYAARVGWAEDLPAGYEAQVRAGYGRNPVAQRAVKVMMEALAGAPLADCDPAAAALVAGRSGGQALLATVAAHLLLHGRRW